jgi:hypothetical protein
MPGLIQACSVPESGLFFTRNSLFLQSREFASNPLMHGREIGGKWVSDPRISRNSLFFPCSQGFDCKDRHVTNCVRHQPSNK